MAGESSRAGVPGGGERAYGRPTTARPAAGRAAPGRSAAPQEPSIGDLLSTLIDQTKVLVRDEVALARREISRKLVVAGAGVGFLGLAALFALATLIMVLVTLMTILAALGVPVWLSALLATLVGAGAAAGLGVLGLRRLQADRLLPQRTLRQLAADARAIREQMQ